MVINVKLTYAKTVVNSVRYKSTQLGSVYIPKNVFGGERADDEYPKLITGELTIPAAETKPTEQAS